jgi:hypothetical protein
MNMTQSLFNMGAMMPIQIINRYADKYGLSVPDELKDHPALNAYYIANQPITLNQTQEELPTEVAKVLEDLANKLDPEQSMNPLRRLFSGS